ncbi:hypothetical protein RYX45_15855 [Alkalihalophilus pseudofirmus]|uniref:Uncharacterized protein n=1 Tax=Alkalihalophilus pseudofirmus TaxID=79885 RepID=A0AAJ2U4I3_ALKPS|nr:hypothetical protein [Alkalihalophilus pseudofirmus]MDV2886667.1 hypothetical protein [Alkalihalophilus pseudofirmus]WEG17397.1 hypothetical protein PQ478_02510 [Alkalihalophilus pseudofirmus]
MLSEGVIEWFELFFSYIIMAQLSYGFLVLILGATIIEYYEWGIFRPAETKFQKATNFFLKSIIGIGPYFYHRFSKYRVLKSKLYYLITLIGLTVLGLILIGVIRLIGRTIVKIFI